MNNDHLSALMTMVGIPTVIRAVVILIFVRRFVVISGVRIDACASQYEYGFLESRAREIALVYTT